MEQRHARRLPSGAVVGILLIVFAGYLYLRKKRQLHRIPCQYWKSGAQTLPTGEAADQADTRKPSSAPSSLGAVVSTRSITNDLDEEEAAGEDIDHGSARVSESVEGSQSEEVKSKQGQDFGEEQQPEEPLSEGSLLGGLLGGRAGGRPEAGLPSGERDGEQARDTGHGPRRVRWRPPERRGGRHHRPIGHLPGRRETVRSIIAPPREEALLRCRREGMSWVIGVEPITEGDAPWSAVEGRIAGGKEENWYRVESYEELAELLREETFSCRPASSNFIVLFRLRGDAEGICEPTVRVGQSYLLVVPVGAEVQPETHLDRVLVDVVGVEGYFFTLREGDQITVNYAGRREVIAPVRLSIDLSGETIPGVAAPSSVFRAIDSITLVRSPAGAPVVQIVLRLEGYRPSGRVWTRSLLVEGTAVPVSPELQEEIRRIGAGRFALRCYDAEGRLLGSEDFSLVVGLRAVERTRLEDAVVRVAFVLDEGYAVHAETLPLRAEHEGSRWSFLVDPSQRAPRLEDWDLLFWRVVAPSGSGVTVGVDLERVFWTVGHVGEQAPSVEKWGSDPVLLQWKDFEAMSEKALWLWTPPAVRRQSAVVIRERKGAARDSFGSYRVGSHAPECIPLRNLGHLAPQRAGEYELALEWKRSLIVLGHWMAHYRCRFCEFVSWEIPMVLHHIHVQHGDQCFSEVDPLELWQQEGKELPERVYQCPYCGKGFVEGGYENANTAIGEHERYDCPEAHRRFRDSPVVVSIRVLERDHPEEMIRALVGRGWRCRLCSELVSEKEQREHLDQKHLWELILLS